MNSPWSLVSLSEVLRPISRPERVDPEKSYSILGAHWYAQGLYIKDVLNGSEIRANQLYRVERGDFVYNRLFGWKGSFAIATDENDGCYVSNEFPCFIVRSDRADGKYLWRYFSLPSVWDNVFGLSTGGTPTSRNRLKEAQLLAMKIPLPPLEEQHRIVARIEQLSAKIEEVREVRQEAKEKSTALVVAASDEAFQPKAGWTEARVGEFCEQPQYGYTASASSEAVGPRLLRITDIQDGRVNWESVPYCNCPDPTKYLLKENDIVFARTGATTGKSFLIRQCPDAVFASYLIRLRVHRLLTPDYLYRYFQTSAYWQQIVDEKKGTGQPNVNGRKLAMIRVPIPPVSEQRHIVAYLDSLQTKFDSLKGHQEETAEEIDALMPSIFSRAFSGEL